MPEFVALLQQAGVEPPQEASDVADFGTDDELVAAVIDCSRFVDAKFDALSAHGSQTDNSFFLDLGRDLFRQVFYRESFVRDYDRTGAPTPEDDLFAGLR